MLSSRDYLYSYFMIPENMAYNEHNLSLRAISASLERGKCNLSKFQGNTLDQALEKMMSERLVSGQVFLAYKYYIEDGRKYIYSIYLESLPKDLQGRSNFFANLRENECKVRSPILLSGKTKGTEDKQIGSSGSSSAFRREEKAPLVSSSLAQQSISDTNPEFIDPISLEVMTDPVLTSMNQTYERKTIEEWLAHHNTDPMTGVLITKVLRPNVELRERIEAWRRGPLPQLAKEVKPSTDLPGTSAAHGFFSHDKGECLNNKDAALHTLRQNGAGLAYSYIAELLHKHRQDPDFTREALSILKDNSLSLYDLCSDAKAAMKILGSRYVSVLNYMEIIQLIYKFRENIEFRDNFINNRLPGRIYEVIDMLHSITDSYTTPIESARRRYFPMVKIKNNMDIKDLIHLRNKKNPQNKPT